MTERVTRRLGRSEFADLLGVAERELSPRVVSLIDAADFCYDVLYGPARDAVILRILQALENPLPAAGPDRLPQWESGWDQNLREFRETGVPSALIPMYLRKGRQVVRLNGEFVIPASADFEVNVLSVLRAWIGTTFFARARHVYEFGCGPCHNLVGLATLLPETSVHGFDWAQASQAIGAEIRARLGLAIDVRCLDMFAPGDAGQLERSAAVLTIGALEQLGTSFGPFLNYLRVQAPDVCVHLEPIHELYDQNRLFDYLGARYSEKRGYLHGFLLQLRELEKTGAVRIHHVKKNIGSFFHDGWTTIAWSPGSRAGS